MPASSNEQGTVIAEQMAEPDGAGIMPPAAVIADRTALDKSFITGIAWTASAKWLGQIVSWAFTLIVVRLLAPSDYGLFGMATVYVGLATLFGEFGISTAIINLRELSDDQISQLNTFSLLLGAASFAISLAVAAPLGRFFKAPGLPAVIIVISLAFLASAFRTVPYALLAKDMKFKLIAFIDGLQTLVQALTGLAIALLGFGYWALAAGMVSAAITSTALTLLCRRQRFAWPRLTGIRGPLQYSSDLIVSCLSWYVYDNSDFFVAGRVLGAGPLGAYTMAWSLAHLPFDKLTAVVNRVTPALFSVVQSDLPALRRYLGTITEGTVFLIAPATIGMALIAPDFVAVALGHKWDAAILPLQLLAFHALIRSNVVFLSPLLYATRGTRFGMWMNLVSVIVLPASFYFGSRWGTGGIAAVWVIVFPLIQLPLYWRVLKTIELPVRGYVLSLWPALSCCILMAVAIEITKITLPSGYPAYFRLVAEILSGSLVYLLALRTIYQERVLAFLRLVKSFREKSAVPLAVGL